MRAKPEFLPHDSTLNKPSALTEFLRELKRSNSVSGYHYIPSREPQFVQFPVTLNVQLQQTLRRRGIEQLYSHQAEAFELARSSRNAVIVTPTASGKTLC